MAKLRITQIRSKNGETKRQIANLRTLGIRRMHQTVEVEDTPITYAGEGAPPRIL